MKKTFEKYREIITYLFFGVLTTLVGWLVYFAVLWVWKASFSLPTNDNSSVLYVVGYTAAQLIQWIAAVLFAFFTNRRYVFTNADKSENTAIQLAKFSCGRVITFFVDYFVTLFAALGLAAAFPVLTSVALFGKEWNLTEVGAKLAAAIIVIVCNYVFSKIFVFKNEKRHDGRDVG